MNQVKTTEVLEREASQIDIYMIIDHDASGAGVVPCLGKQ